MELRDVLRKRRMVRAYTDEPVDPEAVERIVWAGRRAPSGGYSQGAAFVVVTDLETRRKIAELMGEQEYVESGGVPWISSAPVHVVPISRESLYHERYQQPDKLAESGGVEISWPVPYWFIDIGCALMAMLLAAVDEGLGAGFAGHPEQEAKLRALLDLPQDAVPIGVMTLGHEGHDPNRTSSSAFTRARRPKADVVHRERWGS